MLVCNQMMDQERGFDPFTRSNVTNVKTVTVPIGHLRKFLEKIDGQENQLCQKFRAGLTICANLTLSVGSQIVIEPYVV